MWKNKKRIYLDFASAAPVSGVAISAFEKAMPFYGNPSSPHEEGRVAREILEKSRAVIAGIVEVKPDDIIFTSGATEANSIAILGHVSALVRSGRSVKDIHILYAPTSHSSVVSTMKKLGNDGVTIEELPITKDWQVDIAKLKRMMRPETALISMDSVCGETGTIWNTRDVRNVLEKSIFKYSKALLHIDASQAALIAPVTRSHFGADMFVFDAQKIGGVRGVGMLVAHRTIPLISIINGGGQERGIRHGTEPVALISAFAAAFADGVKNRDNFNEHALGLRNTLIELLKNVPDCIVNNGKNFVSHILNISIVGRDTDYLVALLSEDGFDVSTKSACETNESGSRVILKLTSDESFAASTLRISWGSEIKNKDIVLFVKTLKKAVELVDINKK